MSGDTYDVVKKGEVNDVADVEWEASSGGITAELLVAEGIVFVPQWKLAKAETRIKELEAKMSAYVRHYKRHNEGFCPFCGGARCDEFCVMSSCKENEE